MKMIYVSGDDFAALNFENQFKGQDVSSIIEKYIAGERHYDNFQLDLYDFLRIPSEFIEFVRKRVLDYDDSKHKNFYFENEII